jgi:hypothetical protein
MPRWSLRRIAPLAAASCAGLVATKAIGRRRARDRRQPAPDPPDRHLADEEMEALATSEGMPEIDAELAG